MSGNTLTLGTGGLDPGWVADPTRALGPFGSGGSFLLKLAVNNTLPWNAGGGANDLRAFSLVWYLKFSGLPGANAWIFRMTSSGGGELQALLLTSGAVRVGRSTFGGAVTVDSAPLVAGNEYMLTYTCGAAGGSSAKLYVNAGTPTTGVLPGNVLVFTTQPSFLWGTDNNGFTSATGVPGIIGRTLVYDGVLSAPQVSAIYGNYRLIYPGLPVP